MKKPRDDVTNSKCVILVTFFCGGLAAMSFYLILTCVLSGANLFPYAKYISTTSPSLLSYGINDFKTDILGRSRQNDVNNNNNSTTTERVKTTKEKNFENRSYEAEAFASLHMALEMKKKQKLEKSRKLFLHALALQPLQSDILTYYGEFLEESDNNVVLADHLYQRALVYTPDHSQALSNRKRTLPQVEELDEDWFKRIDQKRDILSKISENSATLKRIKEEAYFQQIYHTVAIEGNTMTLSQTRHIIETRMAISGKSVMEHNEILGLDSALSFVNKSLVQRIGAITLQDILDIHKRVLGFVDPLDAGQFRRTQVWIGDHVPPHPSDVDRLMNELVTWLNDESTLQLHPIQFAALAHYKMVFIHPFVDGNGRTSRLLMNLILMQGGYPPVIVPKGEKAAYYQYLNNADEGDVRPFVRFIAECTEKTLDVYLYATQEFPGTEVPELASANEMRRIITI